MSDRHGALTPLFDAAQPLLITPGDFARGGEAPDAGDSLLFNPTRERRLLWVTLRPNLRLRRPPSNWSGPPTRADAMVLLSRNAVNF
jgi:hypothetical protein